MPLLVLFSKFSGAGLVGSPIRYDTIRYVAKLLAVEVDGLAARVWG